MKLASGPANVTESAVIGNASSAWIPVARLMVDSRRDTSIEFHVLLDEGRMMVGVMAIGVVLSMFILAAIVGNILVVVAIITERSLRRAGNNFLISLAVADGLVAGLVMTFAAANDLTDRWSLGSVVCVLWQSSDVMCCTSSILNICAVSLDRYIHIRDPLRYRSLVTHRRSLIVVTIIWTTSAVLSFLPITLGWHRLGMTTTSHASDILRSTSAIRLNSSARGSGESSDDSSCHLDLNPWYACISSAISFYIPCIIMLTIYIRLYRLSLKHRKFMTSSSSSSSAAATAAGGDTQRTRSSKFPIPETVSGDDRKLEQEQELQSNTLPCQTQTRKPRSEVSCTVSNITSDSSFDFQPVPVVTISSCSIFEGMSRSFSVRRCSDTSTGIVVDGVRGTRRLLGADLHSLRSSLNSVRTMNQRPSIIPGSFAHQTDHKAAITVGCIIGIFLLCWGPFFVINIIGSVWEDSIPPFAFVFFTWLGYINSCANPVIYGVTNAEFRRAFQRILTSRCCSTSHRCRHLRCPTGGRQTWSDANMCYRQVRTNDSPLIVYGVN